MLTQNYIAFLEKRAADAAESAIEPTDSAQLTAMEHRKNREDNREYLHSIFPNAGEVESNQTATIKKMFPGMPEGTISGTSLLKVARATFFDAVETGHVKMASPIHAELAYRSFVDELEKISMTLGTMGGPAPAPSMHSTPMKPAGGIGGMGGVGSSPGTPAMGKLSALKPQTLTQVAAKNQTAMRMPQKTWNISSPASAGAAAAKPGSGTSVNQGGILSRLLGR